MTSSGPAPPDPGPAAPSGDGRLPDESGLLARLRGGDEQAFGELVDRLNCRLVALARSYTPSEAVAEEAVQETWLAVIRGLPAFEGRSSLRTWIFSILANRAKTIGARERRHAAASLDGAASEDGGEPGFDEAGHWRQPPATWGLGDPADMTLTRETFDVVERALAALPEMQRRVVLLRDIEGVPAEDVCNILEITETNQRVLLHRGRTGVRRALDRYLRDGATARERP